MTDSTIHPFEAAGLGKAPFRFVGMAENMWSPAPGVPAKPGGSCRYCGQGIRFEFIVQSADGQRFTVGCDCIRKVSAKGSRLLTEAEKAFKADKKRREMEALAARVEAARSKLDSNPALLSGERHPSIGRLTKRDWVLWTLNRGSVSGRKAACLAVEAA